MSVDTEPSGRDRRENGPDRPRGFDFAPWTELPTVRLKRIETERPALPLVGWWERSIALVLAVLAAPLILLIALAIKLESPRGPVFYRQVRIGLDRRQFAPSGAGQAVPDRRRQRYAGRPFLIWKFRTMIPDAERKTGPVWAADRDPRVTRIGGVLRRLRLDEIPQLFNVVAGQMRLIGPRPERPHFVDQLAREIPDYTARLRVPPGITGLAQVEREYDASVSDVRRKVKYDLYYVNHRSSRLDLKILIKTIDVMLRGRGAR